MHSMIAYSPATRFFNHALRQHLDSPGLAVDVAETDTGYILRADVPGVSKEDINVSIDGNVIRLEVEFKEDVTAGAVWRERRVGKTARALKFAQPLDSEGASAKHEHGVLTLTVPKKAEAQLKRVTIQ